MKFEEFNKIASFVYSLSNLGHRYLTTKIHAGYRKNEFVFGIHLIAIKGNTEFKDWTGITFTDGDKIDIDDEIKECQIKINGFISKVAEILDCKSDMKQINWTEQPYLDYYEG